MSRSLRFVAGVRLSEREVACIDGQTCSWPSAQVVGGHLPRLLDLLVEGAAAYAFCYDFLIDLHDSVVG